ncbi:MAG TPA: beta-ketoacyl-ACP synthase III [Nocardioidaceae bacterium]|nr:beta-ketoacyl-ACP synthase III [Nocardioidaceae bacterium]
MTGATNTALLGIGGYRPRKVVPNADIIERIESSDEWIQTRSGIKTRRVAAPDETVPMMSRAAAETALERSGVRPEQLDCVIVATVSHMLQTPAVATQIAEELGATPAAAFDISAACAGFCYGVALASDMIRGGTATYVLVIGVERLTDLTDFEDRGTAFLFADGAGAAVVGPSEESGISPVVWGSDGSKYNLIRQEEGWDQVFEADKPEWPHLRMEGNSVFRWASFDVAKVCHQTLDAAGIGVDDLDAFIPHQANMRITDAMARTLKLPERVAIARDIADQGNTSAASIPLAMERMLDEGTISSGDKALLVAFGAGLVYAAQVVTVP